MNRKSRILIGLFPGFFGVLFGALFIIQSQPGERMFLVGWIFVVLNIMLFIAWLTIGRGSEDADTGGDSQGDP